MTVEITRDDMTSQELRRQAGRVKDGRVSQNGSRELRNGSSNAPGLGAPL